VNREIATTLHGNTVTFIHTQWARMRPADATDFWLYSSLRLDACLVFR
jgi:hypothetical protein